MLIILLLRLHLGLRFLLSPLLLLLRLELLLRARMLLHQLLGLLLVLLLQLLFPRFVRLLFRKLRMLEFLLLLNLSPLLFLSRLQLLLLLQMLTCERRIRGAWRWRFDRRRQLVRMNRNRDGALDLRVRNGRMHWCRLCPGRWAPRGHRLGYRSRRGRRSRRSNSDSSPSGCCRLNAAYLGDG
jgi:hypothetical protein